MKAQLPIATVLLRLGLSATFLSAVASRLVFLGVSATVLETLFALLLIVAIKPDGLL